MKKYVTFIICLLTVNLLYCKKIEEQLNFPPRDFKATVTFRGENNAQLRWEPAEDPDGDPITYTVELGGKTVAQNLGQTTYNATGLLPASTYQGRVIASDSKKGTAIASFTIFPHQEQVLLFGRTLGLSSYNTDGQRAWQALDDITSIPAVSNDTIFANQYGSTLHAISLKDGSRLWQKGYGQQGGTTYAKGILLFKTYLKLNAVDSRNGNLLWSIPYTFVAREISVLGNMAYIAAANELWAVDLATGTRKWSAHTDQGLFSSLAVKNGTVYTLSSNKADQPGTLHALDAKNGSTKWRYTFTGTSLHVEGASPPAVHADRVYIPVNSYTSSTGYVQHLQAIDAASGSLVWKKPLGPEEVYSLTADQGGIYYCTMADLAKIDPASGNALWSVQGEFGRNFTMTEDRIYVPIGTFTTQTAIYDKATGTKIKSINTIFEARSPVVIRNKKVYYPIRNSAMSAMD